MHAVLENMQHLHYARLIFRRLFDSGRQRLTTSEAFSPLWVLWATHQIKKEKQKEMDREKIETKRYWDSQEKDRTGRCIRVEKDSKGFASISSGKKKKKKRIGIKWKSLRIILGQKYMCGKTHWERKRLISGQEKVYKCTWMCVCVSVLKVCVYMRNRCGKGNSTAVYTSRW